MRPTAEQPEPFACPHCGDAVVAEGTFCCNGCELAWAMVHEAGLEDYYARRTDAAPTPSKLMGAWEAVDVGLAPDGSAEVSLYVDGLRCASCTWVVEHILERTDGVVDARVSYADGRTRVRFDPEKVSLRDLAGRVAALGYSPRPVGEPERGDELLSRLGIAAFATANLMLMSASLYVGWFDGMEERFQVFFRWGALILATPVAIYSAAPFLQGALQGLRYRAIGMDVPIALAVVVLYGHGVLQTLAGAEGYLDSLGMLVTLLLVGRVLERRGRRAAAEASAAIASELPQTALRQTATGVEEVPVTALLPGDRVEVGAGLDVPADGRVVDGQGQVQMALLTGESRPVEVRPGSMVVAGALVEEGAVVVAIEAVGDDTVAMQMAAAVREATAQPLPPDPADALAPWFTAITVGLAIAAGLGWGWFAGAHAGVEVAVATLVVACPCALGLSAPLSIAAGMGAVARRGVLMRDGGRLMELARVRDIAMDKTGTVTEGQPAVLAADDEVLRVAAALERSSRHPVAAALRDEARQRGLVVPLARDVREVAGVGIEGEVEGARVSVRAGGPGAVLVTGERLSGLVRLGDRPRDDAREAVELLHRAGLRVTLLSGDHPEVTDRVGQVVGVDQALGGLSPEGKRRWLDMHPAAFVGDGLNDGAALASARVGLSMHSGVTASLLVADGVVTQPALRPVVAAVAGARATADAMRSNTARALVYNTVAIAAAMAGLVNPLVAAILMPLSSAWIIAGALSVPRRMQRLEDTWTSS